MMILLIDIKIVIDEKWILLNDYKMRLYKLIIRLKMNRKNINLHLILINHNKNQIYLNKNEKRKNHIDKKYLIMIDFFNIML